MRQLERTVWVGCALVLALAVPGANAQPAAAGLEELQIDLWPEYDRPDVLVLYKFRVGEARSLDAPVPLPIPASVEAPHAVAWRDAKGALFVAEFTRTVEGDRAIVSMRLGSREGQLEFYDRLEQDGSRRSYRFQWPGGVPVDSLSVRVQRPAGATALSVVPAPARQWQGEDGLTYVLVELGSQDATSMPVVEISYEKDSPALSAANVVTPPATSTSVAAVSAAPAASFPIPKWGIALAGLLVALAGGWLLWSSRPRRPGAPPREREHPAETAKTKPGSAVFCHNCGTKSRPDHSYCMSCGTKLVSGA